jgi:hypothetical protein
MMLLYFIGAMFAAIVVMGLVVLAVLAYGALLLVRLIICFVSCLEVVTRPRK